MLRSTHLLSAACAACLAIATGPSQAQSADPVLQQVIALAKEMAVNASVPDWPAVEREAASKLQATPGEEGRTAAIRHVLAGLKDRHSSYRPPVLDDGDRKGAGRPGMPHVRRPIAVSETNVGGFGRLSVNAWGGGNDAIADATRLVRAELSKALATNACGLILDVSTNTGGNMWPMMGGIAPLYDEGVLETFEGRNGARQVVNVQDAALRMGDSVFPRVALAPLTEEPRYIAVVLGKRTASSGEILALGFKGQANVRFFGQSTAGATTANRSIRLANGGQLALTTARILDRSGGLHQGPVVPHVVSDQPLDPARDWLAERCK